MGHPTQAYLAKLPGPELQLFCDQLCHGEYSWQELWEGFNGRRGFLGSGPVFREAVKRAGLVKVEGDKGWFAKKK